MKRPAARYGFNPFPEPKKSVNRMINKRPACMKSLSWHNIPYVKEKNKGGFVRMEQTKSKRNIKELLSASDKDIVNMLIEDRLLPDWQGALCPHCQRGKLSALTSNGRDQILRHRCSAKNCQRYFLPHHLHPIFSHGKGPEGHPLQMQAAALLLRLLNVPLSSIHILTHINHKAIESMNRRLLLARKGHVQQQEKKIKFGGCPRAWKEVEADEATFDKKTLTPKELAINDGKPVVWEQWGAIVQRGRPETLVLRKLNPARTVRRAPGPGAIRKSDWQPFAQRFLANRKVILHTDSARSYRLKLPGMVHDAVVHKKRKVKKNGKWIWLRPTFVRVAKHKLPDGNTVTCKAGTQIVDRAWKFIKERLKRNQNAKVSSLMLTALIRSAQYEYWHRKDDLWVCTGDLVAQYMAGMVQRS